MAQLFRNPRSGNDWTANELSAYNITVVPQSKEVFFGTIDFPDPTDPSLAGFMATESRQHVADTDKRTKQLLHYLDLAMEPKIGQEAAVDNFAAELLKCLGYDDENRIVFIRHAIPFLICGENLVAQTDVCVMDDNEILLLLQEDKRLSNMIDPEPQNANLTCLTMVGTTPIFYKITVTASLSKAVQTGTYPETETHVLRYVPALPRRNSEGMRPLPNRLEILRCLEAFKRFLGN
ncbi:hypothetical protein EDB92DRAFT_1970486 [Lactarius akahatsu]|uniref:Uncharacterized protein n=1 Tax=Lactarius akahatsu TaxID=416441 RepID=A0AAD4LKH4_9AGAM|nr:hypothetical protein EDB92DRAFT_1970486 [Lactarius akahatsu]